MQAEEIDLVEEILGPAEADKWVEPGSDVPESAAPGRPAGVGVSDSTTPVDETVGAALWNEPDSAPPVDETVGAALWNEPDSAPPVGEAAGEIADASPKPRRWLPRLRLPKPRVHLPGLPFHLPGPPFHLRGLPFHLPGLPFHLPGLPFHLPGLPFHLPGLPFHLPGLPFRLPRPVARAMAGVRRHSRAVGLAVAFAVTATGCLAGLTAAAANVSDSYADRVAPGVHVGALDLSGLSRDQVVERLSTTYAYLGQGQVTVSTPTGTATLTYEELGRGPDVESMADQAMTFGHTGNPIGDAVGILRCALQGPAIPIVVRIDPAAVAERVHELAGNIVAPVDAQAWAQDGTFAHSPSATGSGIDEAAISTAIVDHLTQPDAPASFQAGGSWVVLEPRVTEEDARAAIASAERMLVDVTLIIAGTLSNNPSAPAKTYLIKPDAILRWIDFATDSDGRYVARADTGRMQEYLADLAEQYRVAPIEPSIVFDSSGVPVGVNGGKNGIGVDTGATSRVLATYLDGLADGRSPSFAVMGVTAPISPNLTIATLSNLEKIGSWTTTFYPDVSNGNGANIRTPARLLNGQIVAPGQQFSFLEAVSPIDTAHGYTWGGVIQRGKSDHSGAMGGGICSASTTMFNAAARAGLQIDERHAHFYYIDRYPVGLDATVYDNGYQVWDLKWTNDTPSSIVIVGSSTRGGTSTITISLWSLPTGRTTTFSPEYKENVQGARDYTEYVTWLAPGQKARADYPTPGFDTSRTRTVTDDLTGAVIHSDTWTSHYARVDGLLLIGVAP
jgi:vancomycin resistance protein YoaR